MSLPLNPKRGEVWQINFDLTTGVEIYKTRPGIVLSSDSLEQLSLRIVAPITEWKKEFGHQQWFIQIESSAGNGLTKLSAANVLQVRGIDISRFNKKMGYIEAQLTEEIVLALAAVVDYT